MQALKSVSYTSSSRDGSLQPAEARAQMAESSSSYVLKAVKAW